MKTQRMMVLMGAVTLLVWMATASALAGTNRPATGDEMIRLLQKDAEGTDGVTVDYRGTLRRSQVAIDLVNGVIRFVVTDWPVTARPVADAGPMMIRGTLVCRASAGEQATLVNTPAVSLSEDGQASLYVTVPAACVAAPRGLAFFVRTAGSAQ